MPLFLHFISPLARIDQLKTGTNTNFVLIIQAKCYVCVQILCCISSTELYVPPDTLLVSTICVCNHQCVTFHCLPLKYLFPWLLPAVLSDVPRYIFGPVSSLSIRRNIAVDFSKNSLFPIELTISHLNIINHKYNICSYNCL